MDTLGSHFVILRPRHESFTQSLVDHENYLSGDLRPQKYRFLHPNIFPFWEVIRQLQELDACRCLCVTRVLMRLHLLLVILLLLEVLV